jgi:glutathione S-transferase
VEQPYRIFGSEMSPYSVKVRSYFRYKKIAHEWIVRTTANQAEFSRYARLPLVPLVVTPSEDVLQDSTPTIEALEIIYPDSSIHPADPTLAFLSSLIEEYGDEWGNKIMFHFRWWHEDDQRAAARVLAHSRVISNNESEVASEAKNIRERMISRRYFTGSSAANADLIKTYRDDLIAILEKHLVDRSYLFGQRPAFADFGLAPELYELATDPTGGGVIKTKAPLTLAWCQRMLEPKNDGDFEEWTTLAPTLNPLLKNIGQFFLPWTDANATALLKQQDNFKVALDGKFYEQQPQKYHAKSLQKLRLRFGAMEDRSALEKILLEAGCLKWLSS